MIIKRHDGGEYELDHLSPSQIGTYLKCEMQYYFRYLEGIKSPPSGAMITGTGAHTAQEMKLLARLEERAEPSDVDAVDAAVAKAEERMSAEEVSFDEGESEATVKDHTRDAAIAVVSEVVPSITDPIAIEKRYDLSIDDREVALVAVPDVEEADQISDLKVKKKLPVPAEELQPAAYAFCFMSEYGKPPERFRYNVVKLLKGGAEVEQVDCVPTAHDIAFFFRVFDATVGKIEQATQSGIWTPRPTGWHCSEKWCGYWSICRGGALL